MSGAAAASTEQLYRPGLEGIIAGETAISTVEQDSLSYRGYRIEELAERASFEEVSYLLLRGELPTRAQLDAFKKQLDAHRKLPKPIIDMIRSIPREAPMMDVLRTAVSMCGHFDTTQGNESEALIGRAVHVLAAVPSMIAVRMRLLEGKEPVDPKPGLSHAAQFLYMAFGKEPTAQAEKLINLTLVLYAEHEFNASTFTARVCTSTLTDMYSAIVAGIGALKGPLHGGANEEAMKLIGQFKTADEARKWTEGALDHKALVMGFGHRVYKNGDHRARILEPHMEELGRVRNEQWRVDIYHAIKNTVFEKKKIYPNVDYPCGLLYFFLGLPLDVYTPLFVAARVSGWAAHIIEQYMNNRIIRPRSRYTGPAQRPYVPVEKR